MQVQMAQQAEDASPDPAGDDRIPLSEAATMCGVDYDTFLRWVKKGVIPHDVVGPFNTKRVSRRDVERLINPKNQTR